jgi:hypothetical protein
MKSKLDPNTAPAQKMDRFQSALGRIPTVSKDELNKRMAEDETIRRRTKGKPGPKPSASGTNTIESWLNPSRVPQ